MLQGTPRTRQSAQISVIGAGVAGSWQALALARAGFDVSLFERDDPSLTSATGYWAGGMLAPYCESEATEPVVTRLGIRSLGLWRDELADTQLNGTLVVAHRRDRADFDRFARQTPEHDLVDAGRIAELEPSLAGQFDRALFFAGEGHVEPRMVLPRLHERLTESGVAIHYQTAREPADVSGISIDCRGIAAGGGISGLRGVKGEMIVIETGEIALKRPVRLLHPRWPLYIVPRANNRFMIGATTIESRGLRRQRALGAGTAQRRLCGASGFWRSAHCRDRRRFAPRIFRQPAAHPHRR